MHDRNCPKHLILIRNWTPYCVAESVIMHLFFRRQLRWFVDLNHRNVFRPLQRMQSHRDLYHSYNIIKLYQSLKRILFRSDFEIVGLKLTYFGSMFTILQYTANRIQLLCYCAENSVNCDENMKSFLDSYRSKKEISSMMKQRQE